MDQLNEYFIPWIISNTIAVVLLIIALKKRKLARLLFVLIFAWACWLNHKTAINDPQAYLNYASLTPFTFLESFINGWFRDHVTAIVILISFGQGLIAIGMLLKGLWVKLACIGAIVFLLAITPLGIGSAFPFSLIASAALYFILKRDNLNYLWKFRG